jgi:hypothetical protein
VPGWRLKRSFDGPVVDHVGAIRDKHASAAKPLRPHVADGAGVDYQLIGKFSCAPRALPEDQLSEARALVTLPLDPVDVHDDRRFALRELKCSCCHELSVATCEPRNHLMLGQLEFRMSVTPGSADYGNQQVRTPERARR